MRKVLTGLIASSILMTSVGALANSVTVQVTASNQVTNIPADFGAPRFVLDKPWFTGDLPGFPISSTPTTHVLTVDSGFNLPGLSITDHVPPNTGLIWFYFCDGLTFHYTQPNAAATVVFTGQIDGSKPGTGVQCVCTGSACSTTAPVTARLVVVR